MLRKVICFALCVTLFSTLFFIPSVSFAANNNYTSNKSPLVDTPFVKLPVGSVKAHGWLLEQLNRMKTGLPGNAEQVFTDIRDNSWKGGNGTWAPSFGMYYLRGIIELAYILNDSTLKSRSQVWIDWIKNSAQPNGYFGPTTGDYATGDFVNDHTYALEALRTYYEATGDTTVLTLMTNYFNYLNNKTSFKLTGWDKMRMATTTDLVYWLYNITGDSNLLTLATKLRDAAYYPIADLYSNNTFKDYGTDFIPKHNVNVGEAARFGPVYYQQTKNSSDSSAFYKGMNNILRDNGNAVGLGNGTEMLSGKSTNYSVETCAIVEQMLSDETALRILGDASIGDMLEKTTFNGLPGACGKDYGSLAYYTQANEPRIKNGLPAYGEEYPEGFVFGPGTGFECCRANVVMGWPYFTTSTWAATTDNGIAALAYAPTQVTAKVANNVSITIHEDTNYPFEEQIRLQITNLSTDGTTFPLKLRIPGWCSNPTVKVNGVAQSGVTSGSFKTISRSWNTNDTITIDVPMSIKTTKQVNNSVAIERGPLVYSLQIGENWTAIANPVNNDHTDFSKGFNDYEIYPTTPWNYGLVIDPENPAASITVETRSMPIQPFDQSTTPVRLKAPAKLIPEWGYAKNDMLAEEVPYSPVRSTQAQQYVYLVPYGAENLRTTFFPVIGTPAGVTSSFKDDFETGHMDNWVTYGGQWHSIHNFLALTPNAGSKGTGKYGEKAVATGTNFSDFTYDADIQLAEGSGSGGLLFRVSDACPGSDNLNGYFAGVDLSGTLFLGKENGSWTQIGSNVGVTISAGQWYHMRVVTNASNIKVYFNDMSTPKINVMDSTYTSGSIGVRHYNGAVNGCYFRVDNVNVTTSPQTVATYDNFNDNNANGWTTYGGTWSVSGGQYKVGSNAGAKSILSGSNYSDFTYEADVSVGSSGNAGLIFRVSNPSTGANSFNGYFAGIVGGGTSGSVVLGRANGSWTSIEQKSATIYPDQLYHIKIVAAGSNIKVYVGDMTVPVIDATDTTYTSGSIGVRTYNADLTVDNVCVTIDG